MDVLGKGDAVKHAAIGNRLFLGSDGHGPRWFLDGRPLYIGTPVDLYCPVTTVGGEEKSGWLRVRFFDLADGMPIFYLWLGTNIGDAKVVPPKQALFRWPERGEDA